MLTDIQKKKITEFAEKSVAENDQFHQMQHIRNVAEDALMLAKLEKGDPEVCWTAAMLHDIVKSKPGDHGTEGSKIAEKFLLELGLNKEFVEKVKDAIYWHNKEFKDGPIERKIMWDADKYRNINLQGFRTRIIPFFMQNDDHKTALEKASEDYHLFVTRFRTETGRKEAKKHAAEIEQYIAKCKAENSF